MIRFSLGMPSNQSFAEYARLAVLADRYEFDLLVTDDVPNWTPCWGLLFFFAHYTRHVRLGPSVTHPFLRHPLLTAANVAALDELSGGRAFLGIGRGDPLYHRGLHTPMASPVRALREAVDIVRQALAGQRGGYRGEVFRIDPNFHLGCEPRRADVPIYLGTTGPVGFRLGGEIADGAHSPVLLDAKAIAMARENLEAGAQASGRDPCALDLAASCWTSLGADPKTALHLVKDYLAPWLPRMPAMAAAGGAQPDELQAMAEHAARNDVEGASRYVSDEVARALSICGTADQAIRRLEEAAAAGMRHFILKAPLGPDIAEAIRLIGERIMPHFRGAG